MIRGMPPAGAMLRNYLDGNHFEKNLADTPAPATPLYLVGLAFSFGTPRILTNALEKTTWLSISRVILYAARTGTS